MKRVLLFILAFLVFCSSVSALEINREVLPNGLVVLHVERHNLPLVMVTLLVKAGSLDEPKEGLAYLTASLLTEGTKNRSSTMISEEIEFIGANLGASARRDYTTLSLSVLKKNLGKGFEIFSDVLLNPTFLEEEIERKKELTKSSLRQDEESPLFLAQRAFRKEVYGEHPYGRILRGSAEAINAIKRDDIVEFYSDYFLPNNSILSVVGDITPQELDALIKEYLGGWQKKPVPSRRSLPVRRVSKKVVKIDRELTQASIVLGHLGIRRDNPDYYALSVMNYILGGGGFSSRLMASIRDRMGLAYDVHSFFSSNKEPGVFQVMVQTKNESANTVIKEIIRQIKKIRQEGVTDKELEDAKAYLTGSFPRRLDTMRRIADFLAVVEFYGLGLDYIDKYPEYINAVTREDVLRVAREYLDPENYVLVVVAKQSEAKVEAQ
jgi:zinc protease